MDPSGSARPAAENDGAEGVMLTPGAAFAAVGANGLFVPMPATLAQFKPVIESRSGLDIVLPSYRVAVIDAWERANRSEISKATVRLATAPDDDVTIQFVDLVDSHGVFVMVVLPAAGSGKSLPGRDAAKVVPRLGRTRKSGLSVFIDVDKATTTMLGWSADEMVGHRSLDFIHPDDHVIAIDSWLQMLGAPGLEHRARLRHARKDGTWMWLDVTNVHHVDLPEPYVSAELLDMSEEMAMLETLRAREELLHKLAEALPIGVVQFERDGRVVYVNARLTEVMGPLAGSTIGEQFAVVTAADQPRLHDAIAAVLDGDDVDLEVRMEAGEQAGERFCLVTLRPLVDAGRAVTGAIACVTDTTERATLHAELQRRATTDILTSCSNRGETIQRLEGALKATERGTAVVFIDLDRFKAVNDRLGHAAGDELLSIISARLRRVARPGDCVGRLGADEFVVVSPGIATGAQALRMAERFVIALRSIITIGEQRVELGASIGVSIAAPGRRTTADVLIAEADTAMYPSKHDGGGHAVLYTDDMAPTATSLIGT